MTDFMRDPETGPLMAYRDGERVGPVVGMGDTIDMERRREVRSIIKDIYDSVARLEEIYPGRRFTPDGHMVGSLGEAIASERYGLTLFKPSHPVHDGFAPDGKLVQVKATQSNKIGINEKPDYLIVLHMDKDGEFVEVYNGPGEPVWNAAGKALKTGQRPISLTKLRKLNEAVEPDERIQVLN